MRIRAAIPSTAKNGRREDVKPPTKAAPGAEVAATLFAGLFGGFLAVSLLKFGNPPIFENLVTAPESIEEFVLGSPWPISWGYGLLLVVAVVGLAVASWRNLGGPRWLLFLPLGWFAWQVVASLNTISPSLSYPTLAHLGACLVCFCLGFFSLSRVRDLTIFWAGLIGGLLLVLAAGWQQRFGGLDDTRQYFFQEIYPKLSEVSPEYLKKMTSTRIFSTLFYPNALAGAILLLLPPLLGRLGLARRYFTAPARAFLCLLIGGAALACLYWSGSKGGWLLLLLLGIVALLRVRFDKRIKMVLVTVILIGGLAGFFLKYATFFQKGATSVGARLDYWRSALQVASTHPLVGTGPGTFSIPYQRLKHPESEMARLVHNDYLEQASDSGLPGFLTYLGFIAGVLVCSYPRLPKPVPRPVGRMPEDSRASSPASPSVPGPGPKPVEGVVGQGTTAGWGPFWLWLGLLGWALQGFIEFGLYLPALSWPAFTFLGLLARNTMDKTRPAA